MSAEKKGNLSINSENMFPIIKKWLYSDHDIFYREEISNACDAITKLKKMDAMGDYALVEGWKPRVDIVLNDKEKTVKITDNGIGMTAEEVEQYINQVAFSGATDFLEKYKDKDSNDQIIGHFGLGFYSTFMVSASVDIDTLSYKEGAEAVHWTCDGSSTFEMSAGSKKEVGTTVTLHLSDDCLEFCNEYKAREVIEKYCAFMPYEIYLSKAEEDRTETINESERRPDDVVIEEIKPEEKKAEGADADKNAEDGADNAETKPAEKKYKIRRRPVLINDTHPLWMETPQNVTEEQYKEFYRKVFRDYKEPLFWIHLNMDYPFNLKGILYFPKINLEFDSAEGMIKLYNNQVFIADNIKEVIPEYLMLLKGVIDCPDLPLNVSRSALQNDGFVTKISDYISKKVAEKLAGLCKTDKENYDKYWDDISPFIKYGCLKDDKFCEKMNDYILFKNLDGKYITLPEALKINDAALAEEKATDENGEKVEAEVVSKGDMAESTGAENTQADSAETKSEKAASSEEALADQTESKSRTDEKKATDEKASKDDKSSSEDSKEPKDRVVYYVTDEQQQSQYIGMFRARKMDAFIMKFKIDVPFMQQLESKNEHVKFQRIDADLTDAFATKTSKKAQKELDAEAEKLQEELRKSLKNDKLNVKLMKMKDKKVASVLTVSEDARRMQDMMRMYQMNGLSMGDFGAEGQTLVLNAGHPLVEYITAHHADADKKEQVSMLGAQLYDLAKIQNAPLSAEEMGTFVARSNEIMMMLAK